MKKCCLFFFTALLLFNSVTVFAQTDNLPVRFKNGNFITGNNIQHQGFRENDLQASLFNNNYYALVRFSALPTSEIKLALKNAGLELETYIPGNAYFCTVKKEFDFSQAAQYAIISINNLPVFYKVDRSLLTYTANVKYAEKIFSVI